MGSRRLTFGQIEGLEPLPRQLARGELTTKLRARLYSSYQLFLDNMFEWSIGRRPYLTDDGRSFFNDYFTDIRGEFADQYLEHPDGILAEMRNMFAHGGFTQLFNFIHFSLNAYDNVPAELSELDDILREEMCSYRIVDGNRLVAVGSQEEAETISKALSEAGGYGALGARTHLRNSIDLLNGGEFAGSIRESISAVESIAKLLSSDSKSTLSGALGKLEKKSNIHGALKAGFLQLYGYTSDEKGIRHALIDDERPNVDEADALFMIGACSSFVTYLINRAADADLPVSADA